MLAPTDYEITEVESGEEVLAAIAKQQPDLILMDCAGLRGGPGRSVTYQCTQWVSAKVRQSGAFEGQSELLVGVAPLHGRPSRKHADTP
jgi:CheY-like chemotaxis protein